MKDGDSAYNRRTGQGHFPGKRIPFGSLIDFQPPKPVLDKLPKFGKTTMPGIFLGYHVPSGGRWGGDYIVAPLHDFSKENKSNTVRVFRIKEVYQDTNQGIPFPLRKLKDA